MQRCTQSIKPLANIYGDIRRIGAICQAFVLTYVAGWFHPGGHGCDEKSRKRLVYHRLWPGMKSRTLAAAGCHNCQIQRPRCAIGD